MVHLHIFYLLTLSCHGNDNHCKLTCQCNRNDNHKYGRTSALDFAVVSV